jgi:hypothetical protein
MPDREKVINGLKCCCNHIENMSCENCPYNEGDINNCTSELAYDALELLKEQELPTELKQKMWNALYAEEDDYEKKFIGKEEHLNWFTVYRPWLQKGFDIAINAIADWEGR